MIIDCFPYFDEKELLELRLKMLYDHVDLFVITEGSHTHRGEKKDFSCEKVIDELGISKEKIKIVPVYMPSYDIEKDPWVRERMQRDAASFFIGDNDIAFVGDCDEIINPKYLKYYASIAAANQDKILRVPMVFLCSRADFRVHDENGIPVGWNAPFMCSGKHLKKYTLSQIRESYALGRNNLVYKDIYAVDNGIIEMAGWHFTWMGGSDRIKSKEKHFLHWNEFKVQENYEPREGKSDLLGRKDHILQKYSISNLPKEVFELDNVRKFLIGDAKIQHIYNKESFGEAWFNYQDLYMEMVERFPSGSKFVEVGSWKGMSAAFMCVEIANSDKSIEFFCVDTWEGSVEHQEFPELPRLYEIFKENMKPLDKYYRDIRMESIKASNTFADNSLDFVFIDASHEYEDVKNDILAWWPKVKNGGILAGHDFFCSQDVHRAVIDIFGDRYKVNGQCFVIEKELS